MPRTPKLCRHKGTSQAYVTLDGREHYLGHWPPGQRKPPPAASAAYDELIARWLANGRRLPEDRTAGTPTTVNEAILGFVKFAQTHYAERAGTTCAETEGIKAACSVLKNLFGRTPAREFGPRALKAVRTRMVELGWCRTYVNKQVNRLKRMWRWAAEEELFPEAAEVAGRVWAVKANRRGEPGVPEAEPVRPVPDAHIEAALPFMSPQVRAMVELQRLTGMRPGEVVILRGRGLDTSGCVWVYRPEYHKTEHRGQSREVFLGPRAQTVIAPWLRADPDAYLFSPAAAEAARNADRSKRRRTPRWESHMDRNRLKRKRKPRRAKRDHYDPDSYRRAIAYACNRADRTARAAAVQAARADELEADKFVPVWSPNRLRHNAATELRREFGIEMARIVLGHTTAFTTEIYAEADRVQAMDVVLRVG